MLKPWVTGKNMAGGVSENTRARCLFCFCGLSVSAGTPWAGLWIPYLPTTSSGWQGNCRRKAWRTTLRRSHDLGPPKNPEIRPKSWPFTEPPKLGLLLSLLELPWLTQTLGPILLGSFSAATHRPLKAASANCTLTGIEELAIGRGMGGRVQKSPQGAESSTDGCSWL